MVFQGRGGGRGGGSVNVARMSALGRAAAVAALGLLWTGCFEPAKPDVGFLCGSDGACPAGYECRDTGCCHRIGSPARECPAPEPESDAAVDDAAVADAAVDAAVEDAGVADAAADADPPAPRR